MTKRKVLVVSQKQNYKHMKEPLKYFLEKYGFDNSKVKRIVAGEKYLGLMLENGNIGVCATLGKKAGSDSLDIGTLPDLKNHNHRLIYTAYLNALLNYRADYREEKDIFDFINFGIYKSVVMIGDFRPLVTKFQQSGIEVVVFDLFSDREIVMPIEQREKYLSKADGVILTATSIFNNTFIEITGRVSDNCDIFLLGPTAILDEEMKKYRNVKVIFGTVFEKYDNRIMEIVADNQGTRYFQKYAKKVYV